MAATATPIAAPRPGRSRAVWSVHDLWPATTPSRTLAGLGHPAARPVPTSGPTAAVRHAVAEVLAPGTAPLRFAELDAGLDDVY